MGRNETSRERPHNVRKKLNKVCQPDRYGDRGATFSPFTFLQTRRFHAITHAFAQQQSYISLIFKSFRTVLMPLVQADQVETRLRPEKSRRQDGSIVVGNGFDGNHGIHSRSARERRAVHDI